MNSYREFKKDVASVAVAAFVVLFILATALVAVVLAVLPFILAGALVYGICTLVRNAYRHDRMVEKEADQAVRQQIMKLNQGSRP